MAAPKVKATFIEPMLLQRTDRLPDGVDWMYELKLDGYRGLAIKSEGESSCVRAMTMTSACAIPASSKPSLPCRTKPPSTANSWRLIRRASLHSMRCKITARPGQAIFFYLFDVLILAGRNVMREPLSVRRALLEERILPKLQQPIRYSAELTAALPVLLSSVKAQGFHPAELPHNALNA